MRWWNQGIVLRVQKVVEWPRGDSIGLRQGHC